MAIRASQCKPVKLALLSAASLCALSAVSAQAQEPGQPGVTSTQVNNEPKDTTINEIIVTATRRELLLEDVPINITAVTSEMLESQRINDIRGLAFYTPGLTVRDTGPWTTGDIVARGLSSDSTTSEGSNRGTAVAVYLAEVALLLDLKLLDLERIEVLLGPQGTLYGTGTLAGAIRYIPRRPEATQLSAEGHIRAYDVAHSEGIGFNGDFVLNIPLIEDKLALRTVVGYYSDPGFIDFPLLVKTPGVSLPQPDFTDPAEVAANLRRGKDLNDERTFTARNTLLIQPSDDIRAYLTYAFQETKSNGRQVNGAGVLGTGRYESPRRIEEPIERDAHLFSLELYANLGEFAELVSATAYTRQTIDQTYDITDFLLDLDYGYELFPAFTAIGKATDEFERASQEIRLVSTHEGPFSWVVGGFYTEVKTAGTNTEFVPGFPEFAGFSRPDNLEYAQFIDSKTVEKAVFSEIKYQIADAWQVTVGGRYFKYNTKVTGGTALTFFQPFPNIDYSVSSGSAKDDGFIYKLNTSYEIDDNFLLYGTLSEGYRIGGANRVAPCVLPLPPGPNVCALPDELFFGPDKTLNKEIGIRAALFDRRLRASVALYHIDWRDVHIGTSTVNGAVTITGNAGAAVSKGIETSFTARVTDQLTLSGNYSYNDAHLTKDAPMLVDGFDAFKRDRLPGTAKHSGSATATFTHPLPADAELVASWSANYQGNVYSKVGLRASGEKIPDYWLHRASLTYKRDQWEVAIFANNIFDKYAVTAIGQDFSKIGTNDGVISRFYTKAVIQPRVVGAEFRVRF